MSERVMEMYDDLQCKDVKIVQLQSDLEGQVKAKKDLGRIIAQKDSYIRTKEAEIKIMRMCLEEIAATDDYGNQWASDTAREALGRLKGLGSAN